MLQEALGKFWQTCLNMCYLTNSEDKNSSLGPKTSHQYLAVNVTAKGNIGAKLPNYSDQKMNANEF